MARLIGILIFIYGIVFGSFYNVIIYRLPIDLSIAKGRSFCPTCQTGLKAIDLVPVFSWILLGGRCRYCKNKISWRYPLVELATGGLFWLAFYRFGLGAEFVLYASFYSMLLITALIDWDHMIICDQVLYGFSLISFVCLVVMRAPWQKHLLGLGLGFGMYLLIYLGAKAVYKREAFGFGDVMLMGAMGLILGWQETLLAGFLAFYIAIVFIVLMKVFGKKLHLRQEIPFGPYICLAGLVVSVYGDGLIQWYLGIIG